MEYEIKEETLVVYFYGEIDGSNVSLYRNKLNVILAMNEDDVILILNIRHLLIVLGLVLF